MKYIILTLWFIAFSSYAQNYTGVGCYTPGPCGTPPTYNNSLMIAEMPRLDYPDNYPNFYYPPYGMNPYSTPWWAPYGNMYYRNLYWPGAWSNNGINGNWYPWNNGYPWGGGTGGGTGGGGGGGGAHLLKPNLYFVGPAGMEVKVEFSAHASLGLVAASPAGVLDGVTVRLASNGGIETGGVVYPYLFYDYNHDIALTQFRTGSCVLENDLMSYMENVLARSGFAEKEISDFREHWSIKIPKYPHYCVYPQGNEDLSKILAIKTTPTQKYLSRVVFMIVPYKKNPHTMKALLFPLPKKQWAVPIIPKTTEKDLILHEWGVGFPDAKASVKN